MSSSESKRSSWSRIPSSISKQTIPSRDRNPSSHRGSPSPMAPPAPPAKPNAWTGGARAASSATAGSSTGSGAGSITPTSSHQPAVAEDKYVPIGGFNGAEVAEWMRSSIKAATAGDATGASKWKAPVDGKGAAKAGGAWGQKASVMANGQDFWVSLKKQVAAGQQGG